MKTAKIFNVLEPVPETKTIEHFISIITRNWQKHGQSCKIEIRCLRGVRDVRYQQFSTDAVQQAANYATQQNQEGFNCYMVINPISTEAAAGSPAIDTTILAAHFCFADADDLQSSENLRKITPKPDFFVVTGTTPYERIHGYWELENHCTDLKVWTQVQRNIAKNLASDPKVINPSRVMRIAGTVSFPSEKKCKKGYQVELVTLQLSEGVFG